MAGRRRGQGNLDMIGVGAANSCVWVVVGLFFEIVSLGAGVSNSITGLHALQPFHQRREGPSATSPLRTIFSIVVTRSSRLGHGGCSRERVGSRNRDWRRRCKSKYTGAVGSTSISADMGMDPCGSAVGSAAAKQGSSVMQWQWQNDGCPSVVVNRQSRVGGVGMFGSSV